MRWFATLLPSCLAVLVLSGLPVRAAAPPAPAAGDTVVVEATAGGSSGPIDPMSLRRLLGWRQGRVILPARYAEYGLAIKRVIEGQLPEFDPARPPGANLVDVLVLDEAAVAMDFRKNDGDVSGRWTLHRLPFGALAVMSLKDTPLKEGDAEKLVAGIARGLKSDKPNDRRVALEAFGQCRCFSLVPDVIAMVDSEDSVEIPPHSPGEHGQLTTIGALALRHLQRVTSPLEDRSRPENPDRAAWTAWWKEVLKTDPVAKAAPAPGETVTLAAIEMSNAIPEMAMSPDGRAAVATLPGLTKPLNGVQNGLLWMPLDKPDQAAFVCKTAPGPMGLAVAWGKEAAGLVWHESFPDTDSHHIWFVEAGLDGKAKGDPAELSLKDAHRVAIAPAADGWLLAWTNKGSGLTVQRLSHAAKPVGEPLPLDAGSPRAGTWALHINTISAVQMPDGFAVLHLAEKGLTLDILADPLKRLESSRVDDPASGRTVEAAYLCVSPGGLCAFWSQADNSGSRLFARLYGLDGKPQTDPIKVTDAVKLSGMAIASCLPGDGGFWLTWLGSEKAPNQIVAAWLSKDGKLGPHADLGSDKTYNWPARAGLKANALRVVNLNRDQWPNRILMKEVPIATLKKN